MKILKVFGVVVGIHLFALVLIFANPGCTSTNKPIPTPMDTVTRAEAPPSVMVPSGNTPLPAPLPFDPNAPAMASAAPVSTSPGYRPTRPGTSTASTLTTPLVSDVTPATTYTVQSGDSLWTIGKRHGLTPAEIAAANSIKTNATLHLGQKLVIPSKKGTPASSSTAAATPANGGSVGNGRLLSDTTPAPATPNSTSAAPSSTPAASGQKHTVQPGETLGTIARAYGVSQRDLAVANNITNPARIDAGKELVIPAARTATSATNKAPAAPAEAPRPVINIMDTPPAPSGPSPFPTVGSGGTDASSGPSPFPKSN